MEINLLNHNAKEFFKKYYVHPWYEHFLHLFLFDIIILLYKRKSAASKEDLLKPTKIVLSAKKTISYKDKTKKVCNTCADKKTWTNLHRIGTGLSIAIDIFGDKQSEMTSHDCDRMLKHFHQAHGSNPWGRSSWSYPLYALFNFYNSCNFIMCVTYFCNVLAHVSVMYMYMFCLVLCAMGIFVWEASYGHMFLSAQVLHTFFVLFMSL